MDAVGDGTRRAILERLLEHPSAVGELAAGLPVSRPAVSQHLRVLKQARLVTDRQVGTRRIYTVDPAGVHEVREYWERFWSQALARFKAVADEEAQRRAATAPKESPDVDGGA
ncbi:MAG TPA: metalloregulator ArsR/SmtB family transcription factor [Candidatus Limnocylindria bacterium]|nr:metalloregulator ArsR/SmtB family transcription factor [Candidatus Limnocylindria bacterium]